MKITPPLISCLGIVLLTTSLCYTQEKLRTVDESKYRYPNTPIAIVKREIGNIPFLNESEVKAGPDWLRELDLTVKNTSKKTITWFAITLIIKKQGDMPSEFAMDYHFPPLREPIMDASGKPTGKYHPLKVLQPGEIVKVKVYKGQLRTLDALKNEYNAGDIEHVFIDIHAVKYDDHTGWSQGRETKEDPNDPDRMIPIIDKSEMSHAGSPFVRSQTPKITLKSTRKR